MHTSHQTTTENKGANKQLKLKLTPRAEKTRQWPPPCCVMEGSQRRGQGYERSGWRDGTRMSAQ
uniref:Uncharacterized protein n=1 Tax=Rhizophora mucronata TaxID=61149 RepID=A0A2P2IRN6_RHIMU